MRGFEKLLPLKGWGNARDVEGTWRLALQHRANRVVRTHGDQSDEKVLTEDDVSAAVDEIVAARIGNIGTPNFIESSEDPFLPLNKLYRMEGIKNLLQRLQNVHTIARREGSEPPALGHFLFLGAPGTGKTTVARVTARILFQLSLISRCNVVETTGLKLTGQHLGETKIRVEEEVGFTSSHLPPLIYLACASSEISRVNLHCSWMHLLIAA